LIVVPQIVVALLSPWVGYHSDKWGRKPLLLLGFGLEIIRALLFAFSANVSVLFTATRKGLGTAARAHSMVARAKTGIIYWGEKHPKTYLLAHNGIHPVLAIAWLVMRASWRCRYRRRESKTRMAEVLLRLAVSV
jgi:MFS family permease